MWYNSFDILKFKDFLKHMENKFQIGNRVRLLNSSKVVSFNVGDVGTVKDIRLTSVFPNDNYSYYIYIERIRTSWWLPESWLELENQVMVFE